MTHLLRAALAATIATLAPLEADADHHHPRHPAQASVVGQEIRISCDRSINPRKVIFDRPTGAFVDDLVTFGYSNAEALAIATRVCRDERLLGSPRNLAAQTRAILRQTPPARGRTR